MPGKSDCFIRLIAIQVSSAIKTAKNNIFWSFLTLISRILSGLLLSVIIARAPEISTMQVGQIMFAISLAVVVSLLVDYGLDTYFIKEQGAGNLTFEDVGGILGFRILLASIVVFFLGLWLFQTNLSIEEKQLSLLIGAGYIISVINRTYLAYFQSQHQFSIETRILLTGDLLLLIFTIISLYIAKSIILVGISYLLARLVSLLISIRYLSSKEACWIPSFRPEKIKQYTKGAFSYGLLAILATTCIYIDTLLLRFLATENAEEQVAYYQIAMQFVMAATIIPAVMGKALLPLLSENTSNDDAYLRINNLLMTLGVLVSIFIIVNSDQLIVTIYGDRYQPVAEVLKIVGFVIMMRFGMMYNLFLTIRGNNWFRVLGSGLMLITSIVASFILVPSYGVKGSAYSSILAHIVIWFVYLYAVQRTGQSFLLGWKFGKLLMVSAFFLLTTLPMKDFPLYYTLPWSSLIIIISLAFIADRSDMNLVLKKLISTKKQIFQ